jgi:TetR/AcrR family transcriptional regulator, transcriptional repressor for nem operon
MGRKGEETRAQLVARTARLMNEQGWLQAPLSAVMAASGLQKGGLYRHFESRDALLYAAFDHAVGQVRDRLLAAIEGKHTARERLTAMIDAYDPDGGAVPLPGGCPIMNGAIEADYAHPQLRERAAEAMAQWRSLVERIVDAGVRRGELRGGLDAAEASAVIVGALEGAVMLSHLQGSAQPLHAATRHLRRYIAEELCGATTRKARP